MSSEIIIPVVLTSGQFSRFARYNVFVRQKRFIRPLVFFLLMTLFSVICLLSKRESSLLLGGVLLSIGILLPLVWFLNFFMNVHTQAKKSGLTKEGLSVYTVELRDKGVHIKGRTGQEANLPWKKIVSFSRCGDLTCLYISQMQAYLLPDNCLPCSKEALSEMLAKHIKA